MITRESLKRALTVIDREMDENGTAGQGKNGQQHMLQIEARSRVCKNLDAILTIEHRLARKTGRVVRVAFDVRDGEPVAIVQVVGSGVWNVHNLQSVQSLDIEI